MKTLLNPLTGEFQVTPKRIQVSTIGVNASNPLTHTDIRGSFTANWMQVRVQATGSDNCAGISLVGVNGTRGGAVFASPSTSALFLVADSADGNLSFQNGNGARFSVSSNGLGTFAGGIVAGGSITATQSIAGAFRSTFRNSNTGGSRRSDIAILTGAGNEGIFIGTQSGNLAFIDNNSGGPFQFFGGGVLGLTLYPSAGAHVGTAPSDPGSNNLRVQGSVIVGAMLRLPQYTVGTAPSASANLGGTIYVSNESGGATTAFGDGTNWRRSHDRAVIS